MRRFHTHCALTLPPSASLAVLLEARGIQRVRVWPRGVDRQLFGARQPATPHAVCQSAAFDDDDTGLCFFASARAAPPCRTAPRAHRARRALRGVACDDCWGCRCAYRAARRAVALGEGPRRLCGGGRAARGGPRAAPCRR
eukprot:1860400-Prymnesium_polylepis.1